MDSKELICSLSIVIGPMCSGKSSELCRRISRYNSIHKKCVLINSIKDTRVQGNYVLTHNNLKKNAIKTEFLMDIKDNDDYLNADVIGIDEGQFYEDLFDFVNYTLKNHKKIIIISGLDGDHLQKKFGQILDCIPLCDEVIKLSALCMKCRDGTKAIFTKRIVNNNEQILVGSDESYISVCRKCHKK